jgi:hypothetical protein
VSNRNFLFNYTTKQSRNSGNVLRRPSQAEGCSTNGRGRRRRRRRRRRMRRRRRRKVILIIR